MAPLPFLRTQDDEESEARVWLDRGMSCGLAMSRSLGDLDFKEKGVTSFTAFKDKGTATFEQYHKASYNMAQLRAKWGGVGYEAGIGG